MNKLAVLLGLVVVLAAPLYMYLKESSISSETLYSTNKIVENPIIGIVVPPKLGPKQLNNQKSYTILRKNAPYMEIIHQNI